MSAETQDKDQQPCWQEHWVVIYPVSSIPINRLLFFHYFYRNRRLVLSPELATSLFCSEDALLHTVANKHWMVIHQTFYFNLLVPAPSACLSPAFLLCRKVIFSLHQHAQSDINHNHGTVPEPNTFFFQKTVGGVSPGMRN